MDLTGNNKAVGKVPPSGRFAGFSLSLTDLLTALHRLGKIIVHPFFRADFIPVQDVPVELLHIGVQRRHTVFPAETNPHHRTGRFEGGIDQRQKPTLIVTITFL